MARKYSEAIKKANKAWDEANKERKRYLTYRSTAKSFSKIATKEDAETLIELLNNRLKELDNE